MSSAMRWLCRYIGSTSQPIVKLLTRQSLHRSADMPSIGRGVNLVRQTPWESQRLPSSVISWHLLKSQKQLHLEERLP